MAHLFCEHGYLVHELPRPFSATPTGLVMSEGQDVSSWKSRPMHGRAGLCRIGRVEWDPKRVHVARHAGCRAVEQAAWPLSAIDLVCLTGLVAKTSDEQEIETVWAVWREPERLVVTAIGGGLGHTFGASGVLQVIAAACALTERVVPPIVNGMRTLCASRLNLLTGSRKRVRSKRRWCSREDSAAAMWPPA